MALLPGCSALPARQTGGQHSAARPSATAPTPSAAPKRAVFLTIGDFGAGSDAQRRVAAAMRQWAKNGRHVDAIVTTGDNVYPDGSPGKFSQVLTGPYRGLNAPLWAALGNHDVQGGHGPAQLRRLGLPRPPFTKQLAGAELLFLDGNRDFQTQARWLDDRLSRPGPKLRIVVFHQPAWSCSLHGSTPTVDRYWVPVLERHKVALVLNGHDHNYQRFTSRKGVTYVVTGGGGAGLYPVRDNCRGLPRKDAAAERHHFLAAEITGDTLRLSAIGPSGNTFDQVTIKR